MKFTKMHGLGNDYIYVNCFVEQVENPEKAAKRLSCRHTGIGADGLILIGPSTSADFEMRIYNADGTRAEMCGNGIRCMAKYVYEKEMTRKKRIMIETGAGIREVSMSIHKDKVEKVRVDMGKPILNASRIPILSNSNTVINKLVHIHERDYMITGVSMGNPHVVTYVNNLDQLEIAEVGPQFEYYEKFPNRINVEFVEVIDKKTVNMRVWERGAGETMACGTGACAVLVASVLNNLTDYQVRVKLLGGDLFVEWNRMNGHVYMEGPAVSVFDGEIDI